MKLEKVKGHRKHINLKWNEDTNWLSLKALESVFLAVTLAPSRPKQKLTAHSQNTAFTWHTRKRR